MKKTIQHMKRSVAKVLVAQGTLML